MSATLIYTSREEIEVHKFNPGVTIGIPLLAIFLQAYIPVMWHGRLSFFNVLICRFWSPSFSRLRGVIRSRERSPGA